MIIFNLILLRNGKKINSFGRVSSKTNINSILGQMLGKDQCYYRSYCISFYKI